MKLLLQDAHEFLCQCLDQLKEEVSKVNKSLTPDPVVTSGVCVGGSGAQKEVGSSHVYTCPVVNNMEFEVQHTITCSRYLL